MTTITRSFDIDAGHRLLKHEGKCRNLHGHRYRVEVTVSADSLDAVGRIIDFGVVKQKFGRWLEDTYDHGFIVEAGDPLIPWLEEHQQKYHVMPCPPSIENLVEAWFTGAVEILKPLGVAVSRIRGYETEKCWADFSR